MRLLIYRNPLKGYITSMVWLVVVYLASPYMRSFMKDTVGADELMSQYVDASFRLNDCHSLQLCFPLHSAGNILTVNFLSRRYSWH